MGAVLAGPRAGLFSAMVLCTSLYHYIVGRINTLDMTLAVAMIVAIFPAFLYLSGKRQSRRYLILSYAGAALAFLAKGLIGIVFPAAILLLWMLLSRRRREIGQAISLPGLALFLAIALPWVVLVQRANPDFLWFFFVQEHFLRYTTKIHHHYEPFWFFFPIVFAGLLPWLAFARRAVRAAWDARETYLAAEDRRFLFCWVLFIFLFFSFSNSKLVTYAAPLFPPLAVLFGRALDLWADREDGSVRCRAPLALAAILAAGIVLFPSFTRYPIEPSRWVPLCALPAALILAWGVMPLFIRRLSAERVVHLSFLLLALFLISINRPAAEYLGNYKSVKKLSAVLSASLRDGDVVAQYQTYRQGIPFYTKRRCVLVGYAGELEFGADRAADRKEFFLDDAAFLALWNSPARVFCVGRSDKLPLFREKFPGHRLLYRSDEGILIVNRL
jgi:4-amino-4-deoxy-L-arabinose transferase-like glycosyltransferase